MKLCIHNRKGLTFVEVMVTLVIISLGMTAVFRTFIFSLNKLEYLTTRIYAEFALERKISSLQRDYKAYRTLPFDFEPTDKTLLSGSSSIDIQQHMDVQPVKPFPDLLSVKCALEWNQNGQNVHLDKEAYILGRYLEDSKQQAL